MYLIIILLPIFTVGNNVSFQKDLKNPCVYPQKVITIKSTQNLNTISQIVITVYFSLADLYLEPI